MRKVAFFLIAMVIAELLISCGRNPSGTNNGDVHNYFYLDSITTPVYIAYYSNNGTVSPEFYRQSYFIFSSDGILRHRCTKYDGTLTIDHDIFIGDSFFNAADSFISANDFNSFDSSYVNHELCGGQGRSIIVNTTSINKTIGIYGMWADSLPPALWSLEEMLQNEIQRVDTIHQ